MVFVSAPVSPKFLQKSKPSGNMTAQFGSYVTIPCDGTGSPALNITWLKNNKTLQVERKQLNKDQNNVCLTVNDSLNPLI